MEIIKAPIYVKLTEEERKTLRDAYDILNETLSFITNDLANDPLVCEATFTTHKTIVFKKGE